MLLHIWCTKDSVFFVPFDLSTVLCFPGDGWVGPGAQIGRGQVWRSTWNFTEFFFVNHFFKDICILEFGQKVMFYLTLFNKRVASIDVENILPGFFFSLSRLCNRLYTSKVQKNSEQRKILHKKQRVHPKKKYSCQKVTILVFRRIYF